MRSMPTIQLTLALCALIGFVALYYVVRAAVCAGILDADRKRQLAEAERQRVLAQQRSHPY